MKSSLKLAALLLSVAAAGLARADTFNLDFDTATGATDASAFAPSIFSFHNATFAPDLDGFGDPIVGSEHWQIDTASDTSSPVQVDSTSANGWGAAPSGSFALDGRPQSILIQFDQTYNLDAFSVALDNSTFGNLGTVTIDFLSGSSIIGHINLDQTQNPGQMPGISGLTNVTGFVLPSGAFYDNLSVSVTAVPEPSTWALIFGAVGLGFAVVRRRRQG